MTDLKPTSAEILSRADQLETLVKLIPSPPLGDYHASQAAIREARQKCVSALHDLSDTPVQVAETSNGWRIRMMGITATCTAGFGGACHNWIAQARRKHGGKGDG